MTILRWVTGSFAALMAFGALFSYLIHSAFDVPVWLKRARRLRHWAWLTLLLWFNVEVWGRVVFTAVN
ncbi:MAG: hypothetical protein ABIV63_21865 [Caldimonas sp.]